MNYVKEVSDLFLTRRKGVEILSPVDYETIAEWEKEEIPLDVVLYSINHFFDNLPSENEQTEISISSFQMDVKKEYANWLLNLNQNV